VAATIRTDILSPYETRASLVRGVSSPMYLMPVARNYDTHCGWHRLGKVGKITGQGGVGYGMVRGFENVAASWQYEGKL
jgi:hypothetical protein